MPASGSWLSTAENSVDGPRVGVTIGVLPTAARQLQTRMRRKRTRVNQDLPREANPQSCTNLWSYFKAGKDIQDPLQLIWVANCSNSPTFFPRSTLQQRAAKMPSLQQSFQRMPSLPQQSFDQIKRLPKKSNPGSLRPS